MVHTSTSVWSAAREIASSVALQKTIFFNTWFSISWFICTIVILARKVGFLVLVILQDLTQPQLT